MIINAPNALCFVNVIRESTEATVIVSSVFCCMCELLWKMHFLYQELVAGNIPDKVKKTKQNNPHTPTPFAVIFPKYITYS